MLTSDLSKKSLNEEKKIIIIRHGRTEMNEQLAIQEWGSDNFVDKRLFDTKLTVTGIRQAQTLNKEIISKSLGEIDLLISSPLSRTLQTAELAFKGKFCFLHENV
jgi:broad specificity phosphatase PhoE